MREVKRLRHWSLFCMTNIVFHAGFGYNDASDAARVVSAFCGSNDNYSEAHSFMAG
jgi:hypothetical protein